MNYLDTFKNNRFVHYAGDGEDTSNWWDDFLGSVRDLNQVRINNPAGVILRNEEDPIQREFDSRAFSLANHLGMMMGLVGTDGGIDNLPFNTIAAHLGFWPNIVNVAQLRSAKEKMDEQKEKQRQQRIEQNGSKHRKGLMPK